MGKERINQANTRDMAVSASESVDIPCRFTSSLAVIPESDALRRA
jgi:hypothetical protein